MNRTQKFESYATHPWLKRVYGKLKQADLELARKFIADNDALDCGAFEGRVNRMFLDQPNKPKRANEIMELLSCANKG